jgi:hypothetical protein
MKIRLLAVLSAALFFYALFFFHPPLWLTAAVILPSALFLPFLCVVTVNAASAGKLRPLEPAQDGSRLRKLDADVSLMHSLHFKRIDSFRTPTIPESLDLVFMHPSEPVFAIARLFENKRTWELITFFEGADLTTASDIECGNAPRPAGRPLQIFEDAGPESLLDSHRTAIRVLASRGRTPAEIPEPGFRKAYLARQGELYGHLRSHSFWPFRLAVWTIRKRGRMFCAPLSDRPGEPQFPAREPAGRPAPVPHAATPALFQVVFRGTVREGFMPGHVRDNLARKFRLDPAKADALFSGDPVVIRSGVDMTAARKVRDAFYGAGALCVIEARPDPEAAPEAVQAAVPGAAPEAVKAPGGIAPGVIPPSEPKRTEEEKEFEALEIQRLLRSERAALERDFGAHQTLGPLPYVLSLSSLIPLFGIAGGIGAILYGLSKRRLGGMKIVLIGSAGLIFTLMNGVSDFYTKMKQPVSSQEPAPVRLTEIRLNDLVRGLEAYRERNGAYPDSLVQMLDQADTTYSILDPMDSQPPDVGQRRLVYEPGPTREAYRLFSAGPDGAPGTADDIFPSLAPEALAGTGYRR